MQAALTPADRSALFQLAATYALAVDQRTFERLRDVFVPDAVLETPRGVRDGVEEIVDALEGLRRYEATAHHLGQQLLTPEGDAECTGITYCEAHHLVADGEVRTDWVMHIRYHDHFVRTPAGWRIRHRHLEEIWSGKHPVG